MSRELAFGRFLRRGLIIAYHEPPVGDFLSVFVRLVVEDIRLPVWTATDGLQHIRTHGFADIGGQVALEGAQGRVGDPATGDATLSRTAERAENRGR